MFALQVKDIYKTYRIYSAPVDRLREIIFRRPFHEEFTALASISFDIRPGQTVGIIGDNGAGKSTLLKILAGTLSPSSGEIHVNGKVAALLELGAGFHPEITGRKNIYLNGALMGFSEREIKEKEKEIIKFSELEEFINRPVKTYSSGMKVRLAFSIATSVDPDILIIDEALSVGDHSFQQKCIARMQNFKKAGKTMLFCSHSMYLVNELCDFTVWLEKGRITGIGETSDVISAYIAHQDRLARKSEDTEEKTEETASTELFIESVEAVDDINGHDTLTQFNPVTLRARVRRLGNTALPGHAALGLVNMENKLIFGSTTMESNLPPVIFKDTTVIELRIPRLTLGAGAFRPLLVIGDESTMRCIAEKKGPIITVRSARPEMRLVWMEHNWNIT